MSVIDGANMTLDVRYQFNNGPIETIYGWPSLDWWGQATIWTNSLTAPGVYTFVAIRNTFNPNWVPVAASVTVWAPAPPEPTSLSINPTSVNPGQAYTMTVGNGANMTIDVQYQFNFGPVQEVKAWATLNSFGQAAIWTDPQSPPGPLTFLAIRNTQYGSWLPVSSSVTILPRRPTSLTITPSSVTAGQGLYSMFVGNGANMTLDVQYRLNGGAKQSIYGWPTLNPFGIANIWPEPCTVPGNYTYTDIRNTLDTEWLPVNASIIVNAAAPVVSSVSPAAAKRNSSVSVTITGSNLWCASLSTSWPGLTFSNILQSADGTSVTATFNLSPTANVGLASVTLNARGLTTNFTFGVTSNTPPTISGLSPSNGGKGTSVPVVITGANLYGATLSTTWTGLTFANVIPSTDGTSVNARFDISPSAALGNPPIQVVTSAGSVTTQLFSIVTTTSISAKEYIYLGNKMIAVRTATPPQP